MSKQTIDIGASANDNSGSTLRDGAIIVNNNFNELYGTSALGNNSELLINVSSAVDGQVLRFDPTAGGIGKFVASDYNKLTSSLNVNGNAIVSQNNGNIAISPNGTGDAIINFGTSTATFDSSANIVDFSGAIHYNNEYTSLSNAPAASGDRGYFFSVNGDDNPYVNINITAGGVGNTRAKLITEYSSIDLLGDVDTTSNAPTTDQVLAWNGTAWVPADQTGGGGGASQNLYATFTADTGSTTANSLTDSLTVTGGTDITTSIVGDVLTVNFSGTIPTTVNGLTDTNFTGIAQGNSFYWNGSAMVPSASPMIWWEVNANGNADYTFAGPGFTGTVSDPTLYVYRGFTYAFDNSVQGGGHPFRIQTTQGLSGTPYTTGQTGSGSNILYWTVPLDAPNTLYYQCTLHAAMQGTITVVS